MRDDAGLLSAHPVDVAPMLLGAVVESRLGGSRVAVLIRAGEVIDGVERARERRGAAVRDRDLARGPGRLSVALGITVSLNGVNLLSRRGHLRLSLPDHPVAAYDVSPRTGVSGDGAETPWRFLLRDEPTVSPYRRAPR